MIREILLNAYLFDRVKAPKFDASSVQSGTICTYTLYRDDENIRRDRGSWRRSTKNLLGIPPFRVRGRWGLSVLLKAALIAPKRAVEILEVRQGIILLGVPKKFLQVADWFAHQSMQEPIYCGARLERVFR